MVDKRDDKSQGVIVSKYKKELHARVLKTVAGDLKLHVVTQIHADGQPGRLWRCARPQSSVYSFTVCAPPGWLIVYGDMGECMWSRHRDMLPFIRGSAGSLGYFSQKVSRNCEIREKVPALAEEWLADAPKEWKASHGKAMTAEQRQVLSDIKDAYHSYEDIADLQRAIYESRMFDSPSYIPSCEYYTYQYLWTVEALKWFVAKLDAGDFVVGKDFSW